MSHQHQIAMTDNGCQDVVEIVRDTASELSDGLHLGRLGNLTLQLGFLAIVLQAQKHRRLAQTPTTYEPYCTRLIGLITHEAGYLPGKMLSAGITAVGFAYRRFTFPTQPTPRTKG